MQGGAAIAATLFGLNDRLGGKLAATWMPADFVDTVPMTDMAFDSGAGRT